MANTTLNLCTLSNKNYFLSQQPSEFTRLGYCIFKIRIFIGKKTLLQIFVDFDVHVTMRRNKFLKIKPTLYTNFSNLFLEWRSTCIGQFLCPSSGDSHCTHSNGICHTGLLTACVLEHMLLLASCQETCMTYTISVCTRNNYWLWTEELSETCRISF